MAGILLVASCQLGWAQTTSLTDGATPLGLAPGSPAGSFALSGFDTVNPYKRVSEILCKSGQRPFPQKSSLFATPDFEAFKRRGILQKTQNTSRSHRISDTPSSGDLTDMGACISK
jgi:hypothetical protein